MLEPDIRVNGDHNRTAGRDYHEYKPIDPIEICPGCEVRFLTKGRQLCRRCENLRCRKQAHEQKIQQIRARLTPILKTLVACLIFVGLVIFFGPSDWQREAYVVLTIVGLLLIFVLVSAGKEIEKLESKFKNTEDDSL